MNAVLKEIVNQILGYTILKLISSSLKSILKNVNPTYLSEVIIYNV